MIISQFPNGGSGGALPQFTYTGDSEIQFDSGGWKLRLLSSGTLTMLSRQDVDIFLVGSGGRGGGSTSGRTTINQKTILYTDFYGGGGGGRTLTQRSVTITPGAQYNVIVGEMGEASSITPADSAEWSGASYEALGGDNASSTSGGNGGSGGAGSGRYMTYTNGSYYSGSRQVNGGMDGGNGTSSISGRTAGTGQGTTTREFGEPSGELYANGGGAYYSSAYAPETVENTGNGGPGGLNGYGASGIVIIRNAR